MKWMTSKGTGDKEIPTSALPDIIFMLLFFFMVTTVMREDELLVKNDVPLAEQLNKIERKSLVTYVYIGSPRDETKYGKEARIQVNDVLIEPKGITPFVMEQKGKLMVADQAGFTVNMKVDKEAAMGIVMDVQQYLREADSRRVMYSAILGPE